MFFEQFFLRIGSASTSSTLVFMFSTTLLFELFVSTIFVNILGFCRLTTTLISGAAVSNKSASVFCAAGGVHFLLKGISVLARF